MSFSDKYQMIRVIKHGPFAIFEVKDKLNEKNHYALKLLKKDLSSDYQKEIKVMKKIKSKYIIELIDYFYDKINKGYCIVMELCDGDLRQILKKYKPNGLPLYLIKKIFSQLNEALKKLRDNGYIHRDLKPENILIKYMDEKKEDFICKLTDFGYSTNEINSSVNKNTNAGTENYKAPEIESFDYNNKCDLWSLGVILYELYTNKYIFDSDNVKEKVINRYEGRITNETDNIMINELIKKLIKVDIQQRINWEEYFADDFFSDYIKLKVIIKKDEQEIKIFNGNEDINKNKLSILIDKKKN